jgi:hypothetical protein
MPRQIDKRSWKWRWSDIAPNVTKLFRGWADIRRQLEWRASAPAAKLAANAKRKHKISAWALRSLLSVKIRATGRGILTVVPQLAASITFTAVARI